jgi:hypothetical protein
MICEEVARDEIVEKYLLGGLPDEARDAFEAHYFDCDRCFRMLQTARTVQGELARTAAAVRAEGMAPSWIRGWAWGPAIAVLVLAVGLTLWQRSAPTTISDAAPPALVPPAGPAATAPQPASPQPPAPSLGELGRVEPPAFVPSRLRGAQDEATAAFAAAMKSYARGDYARAAEGLQKAADLDPGAPHIAFFLGASHLLSGRPDAAVTALQRAVALGDSAYLEDAHFYLAKAHLQQDRAGPAIEQLRIVVRLAGERQVEARELLRRLESR